MTESIQLEIDGLPASVPPGTTLLRAAQSVGIEIPTICFHQATTANALCRVCVVEVEGMRTLAPACVVAATPGMKVQTASPRVLRARRTILEMLAASVDLSDAPEIQALLVACEAEVNRFPGSERRNPPLIDDNPMYVRDYQKCVLCWRCVQVCADDAQYTYAINFTGRGHGTLIGTFFDRPMLETTCVFCGQCVGVCPTGALKPKREWLLELGSDPGEILDQTRARSGGPRRRRPHSPANG